MNIKAAVSEYIIECEVRKYSPRTITSYRNNLGIFQRFCEEELEITDVKDVSIATTRQFSQSLIHRAFLKQI